MESDEDYDDYGIRTSSNFDHMQTVEVPVAQPKSGEHGLDKVKRVSTFLKAKEIVMFNSDTKGEGKSAKLEKPCYENDVR